GDAARGDLAAVRADALTGDGQPQAQATPVLASLLEDCEQVVRRSGQAATLVLDGNEDALCSGMRPDQHVARGPSELEGVLQQVRNGRGEDLRVDLDPDVCRDGSDSELEP